MPNNCKIADGLISCYRWFDDLGILFVGVETPTYKLTSISLAIYLPWLIASLIERVLFKPFNSAILLILI